MSQRNGYSVGGHVDDIAQDLAQHGYHIESASRTRITPPRLTDTFCKLTHCSSCSAKPEYVAIYHGRLVAKCSSCMVELVMASATERITLNYSYGSEFENRS